MRSYTPTARLAAGDTAMLDVDPRNAATMRELLDARAHLRQITWGTLVWGDRIAVSGTAAHPVLSCDQIDVVALCDSAGAWWPAFTGAVTVPESAMTLPLSSSTHYNVYAKVSTLGVLGFEVTTAGRDSSVYRTVGSEQRRFLGAFTTDASGNPIAGWARQRGTTFRQGAYSGGVVALAGGTDTVIAQVDLSPWVPPRATRVHLVVDLLADSGGVAVVLARAHGETFEHEIAAASTSQHIFAHVTLSVLTQSIDYRVNSHGTVSLIVTGWEE